MKTFSSLLAIGLVGSPGLSVLDARADLEVSASVSIHAQGDFYAPLSAHGAWVEVGSYGRCWRPASVAVEWRPYCSGHWVWTDCGWYWVSDEPWAWACYHYGYWVRDPVQAWIWIPGIEWAPSWVSWRVGGGYIGWAPLAPPHVTVAVAAPAFVFVESTRFHDPVRPSKVIVNNTTIINKTTVINNIKRETRAIGGSGPRKVVVNEGPGLDAVQKATGKKVKAVPIQEAARQTPAPPELARGKSDPKSNAKPSVAPPEQRKSAPERKAVPSANPGPPSKRTNPDADKKPGKEKPFVAPSEEPKSGSQPKPPPSEKREPPAKPTPPNLDKDQPPREEGSASPPKRPLTPAKPPGKPAKPPEGKDEEQRHEKDTTDGKDKADGTTLQPDEWFGATPIRAKADNRSGPANQTNLERES